jgi:UPF0176 protein
MIINIFVILNFLCWLLKMNPQSEYLNFLSSNKKMFQDDIYVVVAFYKFFQIDDLLFFQVSLKSILNKTKIKGTILIASEGVNGTISGKKNEISKVLKQLWELNQLSDLQPKYSFALKNPFLRMKIKLKKEIVTLGVDHVSPSKLVGNYVKSENWNEFISDNSVLLIDTRNDYEVSIGSFKTAVNPGIKNFREFPEWVSKNLLTKDSKIKNKKIAMFCTGGIRCEKSTSYLKSIGFEDVHHLEGGILKYLEKTPESESQWNGSCFVFDYRVSVEHNLKLGKYDMCYACRMPINEIDKKNKHFVQGERCHHCYNISNDKQKKRFKERQKQIQLSKEKKISHIGPNFDNKKD